MTKTKGPMFEEVDMGLIDRPEEGVRMSIPSEEIEELAGSISEQSLLQPIVLNKAGKRYEIIAGDRRFLAVTSLGWKKVQARVVKMSKVDVALARGVENIQRRDLTALEEGALYANLVEKYNMTIDKVAKKMSKSPGVVKRRIDILKMPQSLQRAIHRREVNLTVAEELQGCLDEAHREYLIEMAIEHGVTKEVARMWVQDWRKTLRTASVAGDGGGLTGSVMTPEIIYRPCDACRGPVDLNKIVEMRLCPDCGETIKAALEGRSNG